MNNEGLFSPRTFSTDWEVMIVDRLERCVGSDKIQGLVGVLRQELDLPLSTDWNTMEFGLGINGSLAQIWERIQRATNRAAEVLAQYNLGLFPAASHPTQEMFNASHIHVGTLRNEAGGVLLENRMIRYTPCFAALAANSPFSQNRGGEYKSYRVRNRAHGCTRPASQHDPHTAQVGWGSDAGPKLFGAPTYEVRIIDCASSRRLLAEMATFVAAFVHYQGTLTENTAPLTPDEYRESLTNRWLAAKYGLQATFLWQGRAVPVVELLEEMLDDCAAALERLGASRTADLSLIGAMLQKRTCQADYWRTLAERYPDPVLLASAWAKLARHWDTFDSYVREKAPPLEPIPAPDRAAILDIHRERVGEGTHFYCSRDAMLYPSPAADAIVEELIERGDLTRQVSPRQGVTLSSVAPVAAATLQPVPKEV